MKTCYKLTIAGFDILVDQSESKAALFRVTYGLQVKNNLTYATACKEFGQCVFHALACEGLINNNGA